MRLTAILLTLAAILGHQSRESRPSRASPEEVWKLTLPDAIRIATDRQEVVGADGYFWMGATKIPLGGFEPCPSGSPGSLSGVYDPDYLPE